MQYITPDYLQSFTCDKETCTAICASPADIGWAETLGNVCQLGLSLACPRSARRMLLRKEPLRFAETRDDTPAVPMSGLTADQLSLMMDARKTVDIVLQDRSLPFRCDVVLALTYCEEFESIIASHDPYAFEELDWGYTEQPWKQLSAVTPLQGFWREKKQDLLEILDHMRNLCQDDQVVASQLQATLELLEPMTGEEFKALRQAMDEYMKPREYLFENLLVSLMHRLYLLEAENRSIITGVHCAFVFFETIRAISARIFRERGALTDEVFAALCWQLARSLSGVLPELMQLIKTESVFEKTRLQRLLWN